MSAEISAFKLQIIATRKRQPDLQLDDRHDTLQGKLRKHQKVLQIVLGNIHLDEKEEKKKHATCRQNNKS